jgi:hypothetical protein
MSYTKPKVVILGTASKIIEVILAKTGVPRDFFGLLLTGPAYELDE